MCLRDAGYLELYSTSAQPDQAQAVLNLNQLYA